MNLEELFSDMYEDFTDVVKWEKISDLDSSYKDKIAFAKLHNLKYFRAFYIGAALSLECYVSTLSKAPTEDVSFTVKIGNNYSETCSVRDPRVALYECWRMVLAFMFGLNPEALLTGNNYHRWHV